MATEELAEDAMRAYIMAHGGKRGPIIKEDDGGLMFRLAEDTWLEAHRYDVHMDLGEKELQPEEQQ